MTVTIGRQPQDRDTSGGSTPAAPRRFWPAVLRGWRGRCPVCGGPTLFTAYLKMAPACASCGEPFEAHRADDAPAYFTILVVGHIVVPLVLLAERAAEPPVWLHLAVWLPLTTLLTLLLLPRLKGTVIASSWVLRPPDRGTSSPVKSS